MTISLMLPLVGKTQADLKRVDKGTGSLTFTRATTATRLNPDTNQIAAVASGDLREDGRSYYNRLLYSEDFSQAAWTKTNVAVSNDNVLGPNGKTGTAQTLTAAAANGTCLQSVTDGSRARYGSIYLKRKTGSGNIQVTLDGGATWTTVAVTSDWIRLGASQMISNPLFGVRIATNGDAVYAFGAQLEDASAATRYAKSSSSPAYAPRGVLSETQRTNLVTSSEVLPAGTEVTISANADTAPDGAATADRMYETAANAGHYIDPMSVGTLTDNTSYVFSVFIRKGLGRNWILVLMKRKDNAYVGQYFNIATGEIGGQYGAADAWGIESCPDGYYRCWIASDSKTGAGAGSFAIYGALADGGSIVYAGDVTYYWTVWGRQVEAGTFPSSYIPTSGLAVTRNTDVLSIQTTGNILATAGTIRCEAVTGVKVSVDYPMILSSADSAYILVGIAGATRYLGVYDGIFHATLAAWVNDAMTKMAMRWDAATLLIGASVGGGTVWSAAFDGSFEFTDASMVVGRYLFGTAKMLIVADCALSDAEMIAITS